MSVYAAFDGGGTKVLAILFDDEYNILAKSEAAGLNPNYYTPESRAKNLSDAVAGLFGDVRPDSLGGVYGVFCHDPDGIGAELRKYAAVERLTPLGEGQLGLLSSGVWGTGLTALSGTGSDIFYTADGEPKGIVGGYGYLLSDEGSGYWIGRESIIAAIHDYEGRGPETALTELITKHLGRTDFRAAAFSIYGTKMGAPLVASCARKCGEAAASGDSTALGILERAGRLMAEQTAACARRFDVPRGIDVCVIGGTWKTHPVMFDTFASAIAETMPESAVKRPSLEPVAACMVYRAIERDGRVTEDAFGKIRASARGAGLGR